MSEFLSLLKQAAKEQYDSSQPVAVMVGTVVAESPLKIQIDQKLILTEAFLILTKAVVDYSTDMTVDHTTENHTHAHGYMDDSSKRATDSHTHSHRYVGRKKFTVHHKLKNGDIVILIRKQGGQQYVVLDVVGGGTV